jgi:hypothetical protein
LTRNVKGRRLEYLFSILHDWLHVFKEPTVPPKEQDTKLSRLIGRTSRDAWLQLQRMRHHPNFHALVAHLETLQGEILGWHVDEAAQKILDSYDRDEK